MTWISEVDRTSTNCFRWKHHYKKMSLQLPIVGKISQTISWGKIRNTYQMTLMTSLSTLEAFDGDRLTFLYFTIARNLAESLKHSHTNEIPVVFAQSTWQLPCVNLLSVAIIEMTEVMPSCPDLFSLFFFSILFIYYSFYISTTVLPPTLPPPPFTSPPQPTPPSTPPRVRPPMGSQQGLAH